MAERRKISEEWRGETMVGKEEGSGVSRKISVSMLFKGEEHNGLFPVCVNIDRPSPLCVL